jgi:MerR family transcriptional regulator/heat shock protein HspR
VKKHVVVRVTVARPVAALYTMGVAAELTGLHPQTLRTYERDGLITPHRTEGNNRLYSDEDLVRARRVAELSSLGMSREAVVYVLELESRVRDLTATVDELRRR